MNFALILSGGSGTRLWPLSRRARPKHLLPITGEKTLFEQTLDRLDGLIPPEQRFLITIPEQAPIVRDLARGRALGIIIEPLGVNNVLPMALSTRLIADRDPEAVIVFLPSDHSIKNPERFREALRRAVEVARHGFIVTLGIPTTRVEPNYGHLHLGEPIPGFSDTDLPACRVIRFHEKPPVEVAKQYTASPEWFWNGGIFVFSASVMLETIERKQPELAGVLERQRRALSLARPTLEDPVIDWAGSSAISSEYHNLPQRLRTSIDFAIMEKADKVACIPVEVGWNDLGGFKALSDLLQADSMGNRIGVRTDGLEAQVLLPGSANVTVFPSKRVVACLDCSDIIVVDTPDALLILPAASSPKVGEVVELIRQRGWTKLL